MRILIKVRAKLCAREKVMDRWRMIIKGQCHVEHVLHSHSKGQRSGKSVCQGQNKDHSQ